MLPPDEIPVLRTHTCAGDPRNPGVVCEPLN